MHARRPRSMDRVLLYAIVTTGELLALLSEERAATRRRSMLRLMAAFLFPTKVASRTPSSYGWKSANQAGPSWVTAEPRSYPMQQ